MQHMLRKIPLAEVDQLEQKLNALYQKPEMAGWRLVSTFVYGTDVFLLFQKG